MLAFIREHGDIDYVIFDKVDRFARNRRDDANTLFELKSYGAQLVSVKENIDETPAGRLLHAIMAGIAEFYSRKLATEALKGMTQKARWVGGHRACRRSATSIPDGASRAARCEWWRSTRTGHR